MTRPSWLLERTINETYGGKVGAVFVDVVGFDELFVDARIPELLFSFDLVVDRVAVLLHAFDNLNDLGLR